MHFNLENNTIPILTTKKVAIKTCIKELIWFIKGQTDNKILKNQNVHIWDDNGSRDFLDSRGLTNRNKDRLNCLLRAKVRLEVVVAMVRWEKLFI